MPGFGTAKASLDLNLWTPAKIPKSLMVGWWDPSDLTNYILNTSNQYTQLTDKSGNARHMLPVSSTPPGQVLLNGLNAMNLNGTNFMGFNGLVDGVGGLNGLSWSAIVSMVKGSNYQRLFSMGKKAEYGNDYTVKGYLDMNTGTALTLNTDSYSIVSAGQSIPSASPSILNTMFTSSSDTGDVNSVISSVNGSASVTTALSYAFYYYTSFTYIFGNADNGAIVGTGGEVVLGAGHWNADIKNRIDGYLAWKWKTQNLLPSTHQYKNSPPYV